MNERGGNLQLSVRGDAVDVRARLEDFFTARGWRIRERPGGLLGLERGSAGRTILLGALAGRRFYLTASLEVRPTDQGVSVSYRFGPSTGAALGGTAGRSRARRLHAEIAEGLEALFSADGTLLRARRTGFSA